MPRAPFTPIQRMAVLDWARKLGIPNVPTMESLEEYERTEARRNNNSHPDGQGVSTMSALLWKLA